MPSTYKKVLHKKKQSLESYIDKDIVHQFVDYSKSKMQFIIIPHKEKLRNKLKTIHFKTYNKGIEIHRYREGVNKDHISKGVNSPDQNTQVIEPSNNIYKQILQQRTIAHHPFRQNISNRFEKNKRIYKKKPTVTNNQSR